MNKDGNTTMKNKTILIPNSFYGRTVPAIFHQRLHRFAARVETEEGVEEVHIPNSGRLAELLFAGNQVGLHFEGRKGRKTRYTLVKAQTPDGWAFIDSRLPNRILAKHWQDLPPLRGYDKAYPGAGGNRAFPGRPHGKGEKTPA
jgi:DNA-binding sugar fermentation-stimulating protein